MNKSLTTRTSLPPGSRILHPRRAFTLVELLVVITIIGILASLITVAAVGALRRGQEARTKIELNQIADAFEHSKTTVGSYPPNCQTDDNVAGGTEPTATPLSEADALADLKRYLQQIAPRHKESDNLLRVLVGLNAVGADAGNYQKVLPGGMTAGEAIVFWLGGFSSDPKYPISGEGGPSYRLPNGKNKPENPSLDPITTRKWVFPFEVARLGGRTEDGFFDPQYNRFIEYTITINGVAQDRRINFWQYLPAKSKEPYMYFDTSRHPAGVLSGPSNLLATYDPPAATLPTGLGPNGEGLHVHALKRKADTITTTTPQVEFVNPEKFQVIHCGTDDAWGTDEFEKMSVHDIGQNDWTLYLLYPTGPFTGDAADTIVNFATQTRLEDAQPQ